MHSTIHFHSAAISILFVIAGFVCPLNSPAAPRGQSAWERVEVIQALLNGAEPKADGVQLDLPGVTQDGSSVLLTADIDRPMSADDYVDALYLFALGNPSPELAEFEFTPLAGLARVSTRIRLDRSQTVVALARTSGGEWLVGARDVRVTVGGCLARDATYKAEDVMQPRVRVPPRFAAGQPADIRTLINHPMETGLRKDSAGRPIPERIIRSFRASLNDEPVLTVRLHRAIAANPYLLFHLAPPHPGELLLVWEEDTGETVVHTSTIATD